MHSAAGSVHYFLDGIPPSAVYLIIRAVRHGKGAVLYMPKKIDVRGVEFDDVTLDEVTDLLISRVHDGVQTAVFTPNSEIVQMCVDDPSMYDVIRRADVTLPDGIGVIKASRILGTPLRERVPGFDTGERLIARSGSENMRIFFLGGKPGIAEAAAARMTEKYPDAIFAGCHDGYFKKTGEESDEVVRLVNESGANVLFVCLGAPAQEIWINENREKLPNVMLLMGLGGSLDGYSGNVKRAPDFFIRHNLEWFYRLACQPSRIGRMMKLPKFYFGTWRCKLRRK